MQNDFSWRPLAPADLPEVDRIARNAHPDLPEGRDVFEEKLRLFPAGCYALETNGVAVGYAFSHPWMLGEVAPLDSFLGALPAAPDCLYLHDIAMLPIARGKGAGPALVGKLAKIAEQSSLAAMALVSVHGTGRVWRRLGFEVSDADTDKLSAYGPSAQYMVLDVASLFR